jgi:hypothetical protein
MGNELACTLRLGGKRFSGNALLETSEILFRGESRLKIPLNSVTEIHVDGGELHIHTKGGHAIFELGPAMAAKWHQKITKPKSVLEKLGVKPAESVSLLGAFPAAFVRDLRKQRARIVMNKIVKDSRWVFLLANENEDLRRLPPVAKQIRGATALWLVYPKGQKSITEADVRSASLKTGLVDVKVVGFSPTHSALKFVLPKSSR